MLARSLATFPILFATGIALLLSGCSSAPDFYPPPEQAEAQPEFRPYRVSRLVEMGPSEADRFIVQDILGSSGDWRWTARRPTVRVRIRSNQDLVYSIDFAVAEATFKDTGPVTVSFWVNDHKLDEMHFAEPGEGHLQAPVPPDWVMPDAENLVAAEVDKVWVAPTDGAQLGIILTRIGLMQVTAPTENSPDAAAPGIAQTP